MSDVGIVRNRAKILATIANAQSRARRSRTGWRRSPGRTPRPSRDRHRGVSADVPASTPESVALAQGLRAHGFRFVGPTTAYALMQAVGMVDDHLVGCIARAPGQRPLNTGVSLARKLAHRGAVIVGAAGAGHQRALVARATPPGRACSRT